MAKTDKGEAKGNTVVTLRVCTVLYMCCFICNGNDNGNKNTWRIFWP